jgi:hypothetical protein
LVQNLDWILDHFCDPNFCDLNLFDLNWVDLNWFDQNLVAQIYSFGIDRIGRPAPAIRKTCCDPAYRCDHGAPAAPAG